MKEPNVWNLIVEDIRVEQVFELVIKKTQTEYTVTKCHYIVVSTKVAYSTLKNKKTKVVYTICLYFVYNVYLLVGVDNPVLKMEKVF